MIFEEAFDNPNLLSAKAFKANFPAWLLVWLIKSLFKNKSRLNIQLPLEFNPGFIEAGISNNMVLFYAKFSIGKITIALNLIHGRIQPIKKIAEYHYLKFAGYLDLRYYIEL